MKARRMRQIRRRSQRHSGRRDSLGVSELFLSQPEDQTVILGTSDVRLKYWLLGFTRIPATLGTTNRRDRRNDNNHRCASRDAA